MIGRGFHQQELAGVLAVIKYAFREFTAGVPAVIKDASREFTAGVPAKVKDAVHGSIGFEERFASTG